MAGQQEAFHANEYGLWHPAYVSRLERHAHIAGHGPNSDSLFPPLAAVIVVAGHSIARPIACGNRVPPYRIICLGNFLPSCQVGKIYKFRNKTIK